MAKQSFDEEYDPIREETEDSDRLVIGTRGSPLALAQAKEVAMNIIAASGGISDPPDLLVIRTSGDTVQDRPLADIGGKGLFTREIDEALLKHHVDLAVHSMKDLPTELPDGIVIAAVLVREDPRDVLIGAKSIASLPKGAKVGTSSLRRGAQVRHKRPDVSIVPLRGNVETRIRKVREGEASATLLALAGLKRLNVTTVDYIVLETDEMLPAVAQGAIAITCRAADTGMRGGLARLNHAPSARAVAAERALLARLEGSCRTPIAALAEFDAQGALLTLRASLLAPDGSKRFDATRIGSEADAEAMGRDAATELLKNAGPGFLTTT